jgi:uncharacterized membrane protein (DUF4010 family)
MKTSLIFSLVGAVAALLSISSPVQVIGFVVACLALFTLISRRRRQEELSISQSGFDLPRR